MLVKRFLTTLLCFAVSFAVYSQGKTDYKQYRILILLDGSSSMVEKWNEKSTRFQTAGAIVTRLMDSVYRFNPNVEFALRVYGHQHGVPEHNCFDTRREVSFSKDNYTQMLLRLEALKPYGVSPIAYSLQEAAETDFSEPHNYAYSLVLITDGGESCNGNICEIVKNLLERKIEFKPYIISLVDYEPLKAQYACLGNYLLASVPAEMDKTIGIIAEDYRQVLQTPEQKTQPEETPKPRPVVVKKDTVQKPPPAPEKKPEIVTPPVVKKTEPTPPPPITSAKKEIISPIKSRRALRPFIENDVRPNSLRKRAIAAVPLPNKEKEEAPAVVLQKIQIAKIRGEAPLRNFGLFWSTPSLKPRRIPLIPIPPKESEPVATTPAAPTLKYVPMAPTVTRKPAAPKPPKENITDASYTLKTEPAAETTLEIYFTDGKGKLYTTSPQVTLLEAATGKEVKKFFRTVNAQGNPDGQPVPAGSYNLLVGNKKNFRAKSVTILPNNKNKVFIIAINGTLSFKYTRDYQRPMNEFTALVKKNFEPGPVITQPCETEKQYESGNYHIELNTLPISRRNLDIDFGTNFIVEIDEPGYVSIINTSAMGKASLYFQNGDMFSKFYTIDITGNPALQKVQLQPGPYQIRYKDNGVFQSTMEKTVRFMVKSNTITEILLQ